MELMRQTSNATHDHACMHVEHQESISTTPMMAPVRLHIVLIHTHTHTQELVTLGALADGRADPHTHTAPHLTPHQFHQELQRAAQRQRGGAASISSGDSSSQQGDLSSGVQGNKEVVLLDARNAYETAIGHFKAVSNETLGACSQLLYCTCVTRGKCSAYRTGLTCSTLTHAASQTCPPGLTGD